MGGTPGEGPTYHENVVNRPRAGGLDGVGGEGQSGAGQRPSWAEQAGQAP